MNKKSRSRAKKGNMTRSMIMIAGVGNAGGNALDHMIDIGINDVTLMAANTDAQALAKSRATIKIQLGSGLGAGNDPQKGSQAAKDSIDDIINVLRTKETRILFITAGMGGGTGTRASSIIAKAAQELDILTVAIVTTPFSDEDPVRIEYARRGIEELKQYTDSLLVLPNDNIKVIYPYIPDEEIFRKANNELATTVKSISEIITRHSAVDFDNVNTMMRNGGRAFMGWGIANGENRALNAVKLSINLLFLDQYNIKEAKNILLNINYGKCIVTLQEAQIICAYLQEQSEGTAKLMWVTTHKPELVDELELTIVAMGFPDDVDDILPESKAVRRHRDENKHFINE